MTRIFAVSLLAASLFTTSLFAQGYGNGAKFDSKKYRERQERIEAVYIATRILCYNGT